jgi:hypothetical protein
MSPFVSQHDRYKCCQFPWNIGRFQLVCARASPCRFLTFAPRDELFCLYITTARPAGWAFRRVQVNGALHLVPYLIWM